MSLADMVNLAGGVQAYQQAQQINPLTVQRSAAELQRLQQLMPEQYRQAIAEANKAETEANVSEKTSKPRITTSEAGASSAESLAEKDRLNLMNQKLKNIASSQIAMINNPLIIQAEKNPNAANKEALVNLVMQNGMTMGKSLGIKPDEVQSLLQPYLDIAQNNPGQLRQYFKERHIAGLDESARTAALSPSGVGITSGIESQVTSTNPFSETKVGEAVPGTYRKLQLMPNDQIITDQQNNSFIISKDNNGRIIGSRPIPAAGGAPANAPPAAANVPKPVVAPKPSATSQKLATEQPAEATANVPVHSQPVPPRFPVRQPNQPVFSLQQGEKEAQEAGGKYLRETIANRNSISPIRGSVEKLVATTDRLLEKTITKAGKGLQIEQYFNKLLDDSEYKTLSKQLARLQIALIGNNKEALSSDAGKQMTAAATGSEIYPPEVLQKIAVQIHGEMESKDKLGQATDKYARRYGENNMASFSQMWDNNADSKVFELMSLPKLIKNKELRAKMAEQIINYPPGSEERTKIEQQYMNIQKLIKDGTL